MVLDRPTRQNQPPAQQSAATQRANPNNPRRVITVGGGGGHGGGHGGGGGGGHGGGGNPNPKPSPWLGDSAEFTPHNSASFVEYLRWMRSADSPNEDGTKVEILHMAQENSSYRDRLTQLTQRTKLIAGEENTFQVKCPWRIRVGGHRGPESILLPAFDALGMPYIPSSTLRGVARTQAIKEIMTRSGAKWQDAEKEVAPYFGSLEAKQPANRSGKVIFLDAYPLPIQNENVAMDMANNIWKWDNNNPPKYEPNPNPFLSLKEPTFLIGLRLASGCDDAKILEKVKQWLVTGLQSGIGSQVNTGYGKLIRAGQTQLNKGFFQINFNLEGQLIHGCQKFTQWNWNNNHHQWQMRGQPEAEVRPVAFKSMLRYWFRTLALGVLEPNLVKQWEANLFGAITPKQRGWVRFEIEEGSVIRREPLPNNRGQNDPCGEQEGILSLTYSEEAPREQRTPLADLFRNLTWMMFHLGGIGQGARRPCYSRQKRDRAPWWRGSTLIPDRNDKFWELPSAPEKFGKLFQLRLEDFYKALAQLTNPRINYRSPNTVGTVRRDQWVEAVDANCKIVVCKGAENFGKPYALAVLHSPDLNAAAGGGNYDGNLCGQVFGQVKPSPVWIADLDDYQVVTVFGATQDPRKNYLQELKSRTSSQNYVQIWPWC